MYTEEHYPMEDLPDDDVVATAPPRPAPHLPPPPRLPPPLPTTMAVIETSFNEELYDDVCTTVFLEIFMWKLFMW